MFVIVAFFVPFQAHRMFSSTDGVILTSFLFVDIYAIFMLSLSIGAHKAGPSRITRQMIAIWIIGVGLYSLFTLIFVFKAKALWNPNDTVNSLYALTGTIGAVALITLRKLPIQHPDVRMSIAISFRVIPQLMLALNIFASQSSKGVSGWFVWSFHVLIACRIIQIIIAIKHYGKDRNRQCMLISESLGWASWWLITMAWVIY
jgi:hypothetical protein